MKLRVNGDSIRLRLSRREVAAFGESGRVESAVHFPGASLCCVLESDSAAVALAAEYTNDTIRVRVPARPAAVWAAGDEVALRGVQAVAGGPPLDIVVEKDFQCLHKGERERDPDAYPNPGAVPSGA